jgi:hypothetical protein
MHKGFSYSFDGGIAREVGLNAAVLFQYIDLFLACAKRDDDAQINGHTCLVRSCAQIAESLGFLTTAQVRTALRKLAAYGYIICESCIKVGIPRALCIRFPSAPIEENS